MVELVAEELANMVPEGGGARLGASWGTGRSWHRGPLQVGAWRLPRDSPKASRGRAWECGL